MSRTNFSRIVIASALVVVIDKTRSIIERMVHFDPSNPGTAIFSGGDPVAYFQYLLVLYGSPIVITAILTWVVIRKKNTFTLGLAISWFLLLGYLKYTLLDETLAINAVLMTVYFAIAAYLVAAAVKPQTTKAYI